MTESSETQLLSSTRFGFEKNILSTKKADFFFISQAYLNAYLQLLDGIHRPGSFLVLIGEAGVGKTVLLRKLATEALETIQVVFCYSNIMNEDSLIALIGDQLGIGEHEKEPLNQLKIIKEYLNNCPMQGISVALFIDDAHHLGENGLDHLLRLFTQELSEGHGLRILLCGPPVMETLLKQTRYKEIVETRITPIYLEPLAPIDVASYISRKLKSTDDLDVSAFFLPSVTKTIVSYTGGIPRLINSLCENTLLITRINSSASVSINSINEAAKELMLEEKISQVNTASFSEKTPLDDTTQQINVAHESILDANHFSEEKRKQIIKSLLADLEDEPATKINTTVNETLVPGSSVDLDTQVSVEVARSDTAYHPVATTELAVRHESALIDPMGNEHTAAILGNESVTTPSLMRRRNDIQSGRESPEAVRPPRSQMTVFLFLALLAGVLGGAGSLYFFRLMPEWILKPSPAQREATTPTPTPTQPVTTAPMLGPDSRDGLGATPVSAVEPTVPGTSMSAQPSIRLGPPTEPVSGSKANPPSTELETSPATTPMVEVTPSVTEIKISSVSPPSSEQTTVETPQISAYMNSGDTLFARGDIASARLFYEAAAAFGAATAMTAVGKTYDPVTLNQLGIKGFRADPIKAVEWYLKAEQAGDPATIERLKELKHWVSNEPAWEETELNTLRHLLR